MFYLGALQGYQQGEAHARAELAPPQPKAQPPSGFTLTGDVQSQRYTEMGVQTRITLLEFFFFLASEVSPAKGIYSASITTSHNLSSR